MRIGKRIRKRRKELNISAEELGEKLGKDKSTIYRYESGDIENMPINILEPISEALDTTPSYLLGWEKKNDIISDVVLKAKNNSDMLSIFGTLNTLDDEQLKSLNAILSGLFKKPENKI